MPSQAYFEGDFWDAILPTNAGETPTTNPEKWRRVEIPRIAMRFLQQAAYAELLSGDGQSDKRRAEEGLADRTLMKLIISERRNRSAPDTMRVLTR